MRNVGDMVWYCDNGIEEKHIPCPDCLGSGRLEVIMGDGKHIGIDCECCQHGFAHTGQIATSVWAAAVLKGKISGVAISRKKVEYHIGTTCSYRCLDEKEVFDTEDEARIHAEIKKAEHEIAEEQRLEKMISEKPLRHQTWAMNACYARKQVDYHTRQAMFWSKRLKVAESKSKVKEDADA
jgi:hypothetical protein